MELVQRVIDALQMAHVEHRDWVRLFQRVRLPAQMMKLNLVEEKTS